MAWQDFLREGLLETQAYNVPAPDGLIKLDAMENPYTWPAQMRNEWQRELATIDVNRYPDGMATALKDQLRHTYDIDTDYDLLIGNGSDELIQIVCAAFASRNASVLSVDPAFVVYRSASDLYGLNFITVALDDAFEIDVESMLAAITEHAPAIIFLAYPNNPTANLFRTKAMQQIIDAAPGLVVVDEAYQPFARVSWLENKLPENVVVMRTLSKFGLAGLRLGYLIGHRQVITELNKLRMPYNVNTLSMTTGCFALRHHDVFDQQADDILMERSRMQQALGRFEQITVFPSDANFILVRLPGASTQLFEHLLAAGIRIKSLHGSSESLMDCLRITIGKPEQNDSLLAALDEFFHKV